MSVNAKPGTVTVPADVAVAAASRGLGNPGVSYPAQTPKMPLIGLGVLLLLWVALSVIMVLAANGSPTLYEDGPLAMAMPFIVLAVVNALGFLVVLLRSPLVSAKARRLQVHVFDQGWVRVRRKGIEVYRWDEVQALYASVAENTSGGIRQTAYHYRITFHDGRQVSMRNFATDMARFGPLLQQAVAQTQLPRAMAYFDQGNPVGFGDFTVTDDGVATRKGKLVPWSQLGGVKVEFGLVGLVDEQGKRVSPQTAIGQIPNAMTFLLMVQTIFKKIA
jgi:hypothetical protein